MNSYVFYCGKLTCRLDLNHPIDRHLSLDTDCRTSIIQDFSFLYYCDCFISYHSGNFTSTFCGFCPEGQFVLFYLVHR